MKTLRIPEGLAKGLSRRLELDDGQLLPELQELTYFGSCNIGDIYFIY